MITTSSLHFDIEISEKASVNQALSDEKRNLLLNYWQNILTEDAEIVVS